MDNGRDIVFIKSAEAKADTSDVEKSAQSITGYLGAGNAASLASTGIVKAKGSLNKLKELIKGFLKDPSIGGVAGAAGVGTVAAALASLYRKHNSEKGKKNSIMTHPLLAGLLGAAGGYAGGQALYRYTVPKLGRLVHKRGWTKGMPFGIETGAGVGLTGGSLLKTRGNRNILQNEIIEMSDTAKKVKDYKDARLATMDDLSTTIETTSKLNEKLKQLNDEYRKASKLNDSDMMKSIDAAKESIHNKLRNARVDAGKHNIILDDIKKGISDAEAANKIVKDRLVSGKSLEIERASGLGEWFLSKFRSNPNVSKPSRELTAAEKTLFKQLLKKYPEARWLRKGTAASALLLSILAGNDIYSTIGDE